MTTQHDQHETFSEMQAAWAAAAEAGASALRLRRAAARSAQIQAAHLAQVAERAGRPPQQALPKR